MYLAVTDKTAEWLIKTFKDKGDFEAFSNLLISLTKQGELKKQRHKIGPISIAIKRNIMSMWHSDYLAYDYENWGIIKIKGPLGCLSSDNDENLGTYLFQCFKLFNYRFEGLNLPRNFNYKSMGNRFHFCVAGGQNTLLYKKGIAYIEENIKYKEVSIKGIVCVGPSKYEENGEKFRNNASVYLIKFKQLIETANDILSERFRKILPQDEILTPRLITLLGLTIPQLIPSHLNDPIDDEMIHKTMDWDYRTWMSSSSTLTESQRHILDSKAFPIRIIGSAGSGKSLLMQLLAIKKMERAERENKEIRILFLTHNQELLFSIRERFKRLGAVKFLNQDSKQFLDINTLYKFSLEKLHFTEDSSILDEDVFEAKEFQKEIINDAILTLLNDNKIDISSMPIIGHYLTEGKFREEISGLILDEIGVAIKGHDLYDNQRKYVHSEKPFSRFHGEITQDERSFIFKIFNIYNSKLSQENKLDSDDIAISCLGTLGTPFWSIRKIKEGYDFVFIDEAQLFNENERRIFPFLTKTKFGNLPIIFALDKAQELRGSELSGLGRLGIQSINNYKLKTVHRCSKPILRLAFKIIQQTTDLFDVDFPEFSEYTKSAVPISNKKIMPPEIFITPNNHDMASFLTKRITKIRNTGINTVCVVVFAREYWVDIENSLHKRGRTFYSLKKRGEALPEKEDLIITLPEYIGGQEFDVVIAVGIENGLVPLKAPGSVSLKFSLEQKALREIYLTITRARYQFFIINNKDSEISDLFKPAIDEGLIELKTTTK